MKISFRKATTYDVSEQLVLQRTAFLPLYEKYRDTENPANISYEEMKGKILNPFGLYYVIIADDKTAGGIYAHPLTDNREVMYFCSLYIKPELQGNGIAQEAMKFLESKCTGTKKFVLEVPEKEEKNIHIYKKAGFVPTNSKEVINDALTVVTYIKTV